MGRKYFVKFSDTELLDSPFIGFPVTAFLQTGGQSDFDTRNVCGMLFYRMIRQARFQNFNPGLASMSPSRKVFEALGHLNSFRNGM